MAKDGIQIYAQDSTGRGSLEKISGKDINGSRKLEVASTTISSTGDSVSVATEGKQDTIISNQTNGTQKIKITDGYGFSVEATPMDELRTVEPIRLVGAVFIGTTIDPNFWTSTVANSATNTQGNNKIVMASGTNSAGSAILQSVAKARYTGGSANRFRAQLQFSDLGKTDNVKKWGIFDGTDGAYFKLSGTTVSACTLKGGQETAVPSSTWNGSTSLPTITNIQSYEIYLTNAKVYFIMAGTLMHTVLATDDTWADTSVLPIRFSNVNSGNTTNTTMSVRVATIYRLGKLETAPRYAHISTATTSILKYGPGMIHQIIVNNPTNNAITVYDNTAASGAVIAIIDPDSGATPFVLDYHVGFQNGLTIVTAGTPDMTVVYE